MQITKARIKTALKKNLEMALTKPYAKFITFPRLENTENKLEKTPSKPE